MNLRVDDERAAKVAEWFNLTIEPDNGGGVELATDYCPRCGEFVEVPNGYDFGDGDWCWTCNTDIANEMRKFVPDLLADRATLLAEVERLRDALSLYGTHRFHCVAAGGPCICGLKELLQ